MTVGAIIIGLVGLVIVWRVFCVVVTLVFAAINAMVQGRRAKRERQGRLR